MGTKHKTAKEKLEAAAQRSTCARGHRLWLAWQARHVKTCEDFSEGKCSRSHGLLDLFYIQDGDDHIFVCRRKLEANYEKMGYRYDPLTLSEDQVTAKYKKQFREF